MKLASILIVVCITVLAESTENPKSNAEPSINERASAQLERLAPFRRSQPPDPPSFNEKPSSSNNGKNSGSERYLNLEVYQIIPEDVQREILKKIQENPSLLKSLTDPEYLAIMQERIKRSEAYGGYGNTGYDTDYGGGGYGYGGYGGGDKDKDKDGSGSGGIISGSSSIIGGIASGIVSSIASASAGASKASFSGSASASGASSSGSSGGSKPEKPTYGPPHPNNDDEKFDAWDFKKAIVNTMVQALKAISGGVLALKGQLIKGSGYLVSTKGKIISSTGEAISSLGKAMATNAIAGNAPKPPPENTYTYDHPPPNAGDSDSYDGPPPPSGDEYSPPDYRPRPQYGAPSDDHDDNAGLLIVKPTKPDKDNHEGPTLDVDNSYGAPQFQYHEKYPSISGLDQPSYLGSFGQDNHVNSAQYDHHPPSSYEAPTHYNDKAPSSYPLYPPLQDSSNVGNQLSIEQSVEYPPIHIQYSTPSKTVPLDHLDPLKTDKDVSVYSSLSIGLNSPEPWALKIAPLKHTNELELPKIQPQVNYHSSPDPHQLKIPLLNPMPISYWYGQGFMQPATSGFSVHRRRSTGQKRRRLSEDSLRNLMATQKSRRLRWI